jgi:uncharacterized protein (TIGR00266 family)
MEINIAYRPSYALAIVGLGMNESIVAEGGAMVSMSSNMSIKTSRGAASGGLLKSLKRAVLGGESFFMNTFTANGGAGEITLAPTLPGDIQTLTMTGPSLMIQSTSYLASSPGIVLDTKWGGMKTLFGGEGLFMLKATGQGQVIVNSFGAIHEIPINGPYIVDSGHIVAFEETLTFEVKKVGSWKATLLSGEGLVCLFNGKGRLWIQSRNPRAFGGLVGHKLPPRES